MATITIAEIELLFSPRWNEQHLGGRCLIGTAEEIIEVAEASDVLGTITHDLEAGKWAIGDYYDHLWSIWAYLEGHDKSTPLSFVRETDGSSNYGFMPESGLETFRESIAQEIREQIDSEEEIEMRRKVELLSDIDDGLITFGRGETEYRLYIARKNDKVVAWALLIDQVVEEVEEERVKG